MRAARVLAAAAAFAAAAGGALAQGTASQGVFCDPAVMKQITDRGKAQADGWTTLASRPETGYTLLGGQSVLEAAGLLKQGQPGYVGQSSMFSSLAQSGSGTPFGGATFAMASCLDNLTKSSINIVFSPPSINGILGMLQQAVCSMATQLFAEVTAPLNQSVFEAFSMNGLIPGLNPGALGFGVSAGIQPGGQANGGGLVNVSNGATGQALSYSPDTGWYAGSGGYSRFQGGSGSRSGNNCSWGSLFGRQATAAACAGYDGSVPDPSLTQGNEEGGLGPDGSENASQGGGGGGTPAGLAGDLSKYDGMTTVVANGQCVRLVQDAIPGVGNTSTWAPGQSVRGANIPYGTPVATFDANGTYGNHQNGTSHAAIYLDQSAAGMRVLEQSVGHPPSIRTIPWSGNAATSTAVNRGDSYNVVTRKG